MAEDTTDPKDRRRVWHIEHGIPLAMLTGLLIQTCVFIAYTATWKATTDIKIEQLVETSKGVVDLRDRVVRLETGVTAMQRGVDEINRKLDNGS